MLAGDAIGIFGWVVSERSTLAKPLPMVAASRVKRSLYLLKVSDAELLAAGAAPVADSGS